jgi:hypothetical protein
VSLQKFHTNNTPASSLPLLPTSSLAPGLTTTAMALAAGICYPTETRSVIFHTLLKTLRVRLRGLYKEVEVEADTPPSKRITISACESIEEKKSITGVTAEFVLLTVACHLGLCCGFGVQQSACHFPILILPKWLTGHYLTPV